MKSLIAFATNALTTVGSTAAGKAALIATTVAVAGTSTAGVASMTAQQSKASEVQTEAVVEIDEAPAADVEALDETNVSAAASDVVPDATIATEDNPVIGHRICFCGAGVAILEKTGLDEAVWAWHILEAHGVKYDKFHNVKHADVYGEDDPFMEFVKEPVKPAEKEDADKPVDQGETKVPVDNGNVNKPVEDNTGKVEADDADKKAQEEAAKKAEEEAAKRAQEEAERKAKEEAERKAAEEAAKKAQEEAERKAKEEAERKAAEEAAKKAAEEAAKRAEEEAAKKAEADRLLQEAIEQAEKDAQWMKDHMKQVDEPAPQSVDVADPAVQ